MCRINTELPLASSRTCSGPRVGTTTLNLWCVENRLGTCAAPEDTSWTNSQRARDPEHRGSRANRPWKELWQLEPLFLVFFLKSIIRNFQYRNNPSKPFKSLLFDRSFTSGPPGHQFSPESPTPLMHVTLQGRHTVVTKTTHHLGFNRRVSEATEVSSWGWVLQDHPLTT